VPEFVVGTLKLTYVVNVVGVNLILTNVRVKKIVPECVMVTQN
jgi:hypothetical protein